MKIVTVPVSLSYRSLASVGKSAIRRGENKRNNKIIDDTRLLSAVATSVGSIG